MDYKSKYNSWLNHNSLSKEMKEELSSMNEDEIKLSFSGNISFGTAGMRGITGAGTNKLNIYTIREATLGYANYLLNNIKNCKSKGIVIGHDNRLSSREFCLDCASLLSSKGIKVYIFDNLRPTPEISYAIRKLKAAGGIIITASHNPKEYNGYKVYDETGCQLTDTKCSLLIEEINKIDDILSFEFTPNNKLIKTLNQNFDKKYYTEIKKLTINKNSEKNIKIVYSPQHGTALNAIETILKDLGYELHLVESQCTYDPFFSNTLSPNPEDKKAYIEAIKLAKEINADLIMTTDPDGDRIGVAVKENNDYTLLTGNQTGTLILDYLLSNKKINKDSLVISSIVTTSLIEALAHKYNVTFKQTLTGFKYIGETINNYQKQKYFLFAVEESYGCALSNIVRDKDSIQAALIISEMTNHYKKQNKTLISKLQEIYNELGYCYDIVKSCALDPLTGKEEINKIMNNLRNNNLKEIAKYKIKRIEDYNEGYLNYPKSNVLRYILEDDSFIAIRPSGTEPKYKIYYSIKEKNKESAITKCNEIENHLKTLFNK